ncbi:aldo/keto reductase [Psychromicrobium xiongbiense]|uniref:aldo/keto reductase n=1 Tax=Psychromicrobium xiongbiense TaxID=3051184 RepID=UPI002553AABA|nr:aldo/keto reductase [Psychromicrobium sp. YIM S02556]
MNVSSSPSAPLPISPESGRLIYGCMGLGGPWSGTEYGAAEVDQAAEVIAAARSIGVQLFDLADIYREGKSEAVLGEVLAHTPGLRESILLQTKCSIRLGEDNLSAQYNLSREGILERVNASLQRLRTDYIDVLLLHRPDPLMEVHETAAAIKKLMDEGKVRQLGVSNMSAAQMAFLQDSLETPIVADQLEMSLRRRAWLESGILLNREQDPHHNFPHGTLEYCQRHDVELQAYGPLAQGAYSDPAARHADPATAAATAMVAELAQTYGTTPEAVVLGWLMRHPARISPVIGTTNIARIVACADAPRVARELTRAQWYQLWVAARGNDLP